MEKAAEVDLLCFGFAREVLGIRQMKYPIAPGETIAHLKSRLIEDYPTLSELASVKFAVNGEYAGEEKTLGTGDEVAIIPPVSGG